MRIYTGIVCLIAAAFLLGACETDNAVVSQSAPATPSAEAEGAFQLSDYELGPGDTVRLLVYQEPDLSGSFAIDAGGDISMPLLGRIPVSGMTTEELASEIEAKLSAGFVNDASVAAEVVVYRPYYIYGEISKAGEYPFTPGMNVPKAIAAAGGFTYRAKKSTVFVVRAGSNDEIKVPVAQDILIYPGDTVRVTERFF